MKKNEAEQKLLAIYNSYECRKIKLATMLKRCTGKVTILSAFMNLKLLNAKGNGGTNHPSTKIF